MRRFLWFSFVLLFLFACTPTTETAVSPQPESETAVLPSPTVPPPIVTEELPRVDAPTAVPDPTQPAAEPTEAATNIAVEPQPVAEEAVATTGVISGRTEEGAFFLGAPNAPITHIDYSDFL